jgi:predicted transcriptional regulator
MATVTLSARVPEAMRDQVDELARQLGRDRGWIVAQAVKRYIEDEAQFIAAVAAGRAAAAAGRAISMEEMEAQLDAIDSKYGAD